MKQITKPMIILGVICIVCAGLLGIVESVTREPIRIQNEATANAGMQKVAPDAASFEAVELEEGENVDGIEFSKLFDRFYRGDKARTSGGFGIGLSLARSIAEIHKGSIKAIKSDKDKIKFIAELK